jgi:tetratricopeptide (TPR) repeat protein
MNSDSESPEGGPKPQKISLPTSSEHGSPPTPTPEKVKSAWLLPTGLVLFLLLGFVLIFQLRPGDDKPVEQKLEAEGANETTDTTDTISQTKSPPTFTALSSEELETLKKQATDAVEAQASIDRPHGFQRILFGKAASHLENADKAMDQGDLKEAQVAYQEVLDTVNSLMESYQLADEISDTQERIQELQDILREKAASLMESPEYKTVSSDILKADEWLKEGEFQSALENLRKSEQALQALIEEGERQFQAALQEGLKALNSGDGETATLHLTVAQALRPNDTFIAHQLKRASVINKVYEHFNQGQEYEQQGMLSLARAEYQKALDLDADSVNINTRLQAINQTLNVDLFEKALAAGLAELSSGNGDAAVEQLEKATSFMPTDTNARSALVDARELQRRQKVGRLIDQGNQALGETEWESARDSFEKALDFEPSSDEAQKGLAIAEENIAREEQLKQLLLVAETFEKNGEYEKALIVLREGRKIIDPSGVVTEMIQHLEGILEELSKPQSVKIISDNQTDIQIYKVGKYDPSPELNLELKPGEYTVIGSRLMYRDVRYTIKVEVGEAPEPLEVVCKEKL